MKPDTNNISSIIVNCTLSNNSQIIAKAFNNHFISVAQNILVDNLNNLNISSNNDNPISYLMHLINHFLISILNVATKGIEGLTNSPKTKNSDGYDGI
jgi:hypothetical protein